MNTVSFIGQTRDTKIKASTLRRTGQIPAVLYGGKTLEHFTVVKNDVKHLIYTPDFKLGEVEVGGKKHRCIIKDIQFHPVTEDIQHIDFLAIEDGRMVKVNIPIRFKGVSPGVKGGGSLIQSMRKIKVKVDPKNLVDELLVDISELELGFSVKVKDIEITEGMELMANESIPVASVEVPRALKSLTAEEEAAAAAEEGATEGAEAEGAEKPAE